MVSCPPWVGGEIFPQVGKSKYLQVLFTTEWRMECEINRWNGAVSAVMHLLYQSVNQKVKFVI